MYRLVKRVTGREAAKVVEWQSQTNQKTDVDYFDKVVPILGEPQKKRKKKLPHKT